MKSRLDRREELTALAVLAALLLGSCLYDKDDRCRNGRQIDDNLCLCPPGTTEMGETCVSQAAKPSGLGDACDETERCTSEDFPLCFTEDDTGYCTKSGCSSESDCGEGFYCGPGMDSMICKRLPSGLDTTCSSDDDCKDFDANYCSISPFASICAIKDCTETSCPPGYSCMDFSRFAPGTPKLCAKPF